MFGLSVIVMSSLFILSVIDLIAGLSVIVMSSLFILSVIDLIAVNMGKPQNYVIVL